MIGASSTQTTKAPSGKALIVSSQNENDKPLASEINSMSSSKGKNPNQPGGKKKGKNNNIKKQENSTPEKYYEYHTGRKKPRDPCYICNEDHWMRDCPHQAEIKKLLKTSNTSTVLTDLFPSLETNLVAIDHASHPKCLCYPSQNIKMML